MIRRVDEEQIEFFTKQKPDYFHPRNKVVFWYGETKGLRDEFIDIVVTSIGEIDGSITTIHPWIR